MSPLYISAIAANENKNRYPAAMSASITTIMPRERARLAPAEPSYVTADPTAEILSDARNITNELTNEIVLKQTQDLLNQISRHLRSVDTVLPRFRKLSAIKNEDGSCLIEWNFARFNIGISLEPQEADSYYFLVSVDESVGEIETKTRKINGELDTIVSNIVQFVINNA